MPVHVHDTLGRIRKAKSRLLSEGSSASVQVMSYTVMGVVFIIEIGLWRCKS